MTDGTRTKVFWVTTALFALALTGSGVMNTLSPDEVVKEVTRLGFPDWFPRYLGIWKLIGVAVVLAPGLARYKEWAMAGFTVSLTSAAVAHIVAGDPISTAIPPLAILAIGLVSWNLRPADRKLA